MIPIDRRTLLKTGTAAALAGSCGALALRPAAAVGSEASGLPGLIDMHCHVFNATDLPIQGYLRFVILHAWSNDEVPFPPPGETTSNWSWLGKVNMQKS